MALIFKRFFLAISLVGLLVTGACKKKDDDKKTIGADATVALDNATPSFHLRNKPTDVDTTLTVFGMKIVRVYVSEDIDKDTGENTGKTFMVYINPECGDDSDKGVGEEIVSCDISGADKNVEEYFNLARPSKEVNEDLNSQKRTIEIEVPSDSDEEAIATLKYARVEFAGANPDKVENLKWATATIPERELVGGSTTTTKLAKEIEVTKGDSITFSLSYDYSDAARQVESVPEGFDCVLEDGETNETCFFPPEFTASATKD